MNLNLSQCVNYPKIFAVSNKNKNKIEEFLRHPVTRGFRDGPNILNPISLSHPPL
jgi:hypothetical protein